MTWLSINSEVWSLDGTWSNKYVVLQYMFSTPAKTFQDFSHKIDILYTWHPNAIKPTTVSEFLKIWKNWFTLGHVYIETYSVG
jgi:hypothetical protein